MQFAKIAKLLKKSRVEAGLTQNEVAQALGYTSPQFISNWERGLCNPPLENLGKLVELYDMSSQELIETFVDSVRADLKSALKKRKRA
jgi:transcriptional regulator with XRE-family HTH domain